MKTLSIFDVQELNALLRNKKYAYKIKLKDACGSQSISLECLGEETDIKELCTVLNVFLKDKYIQVQPGNINPLVLQIT